MSEGHKLTAEQRDQITDRAWTDPTMKNYHRIAQEYGISVQYVAYLKSNSSNGFHGWGSTAPYKAPDWKPPHVAPGITLAQLTGGRARTRRPT